MADKLHSFHPLDQKPTVSLFDKFINESKISAYTTAKRMEFMAIELNINVASSSSSSKSPLVTTANIASINIGGANSLKIHEWKTIRTKHSRIQFAKDRDCSRQLSCCESANKLNRRQKREAKHVANAADFHQDAHDDVGVVSQEIDGKSLGATLDVIYRYSRAYTLKGTVLSIVSICLLAVERVTDFTPSFCLGVLQAVIGGCLANLYVVGLNQLSDIEIDKVNKPHLPLPSGELSVLTGVLVTSLYAILGFCLGWSVKSWPLKLSLFFWFSIGSAYSVHLPLLRWKRFPVVVAMCASSFQGVILPMLFHLHAQINIHGRPLLLSKHAIFVFGIMSIYTAVLSIFKDIPDVEGDRMNGINSFASILGPKRVFWIFIWLLEMVYGVAILIGLSSTQFWIRMIMVIGHGILGFILWRKANVIDLKSNEAIESFYLFIWKLYYAEYLLVPFLRF